MKDLEVASPRAVEPKPTIALYNPCSVVAVATFTYHWEAAASYWIGCPVSPDFLSDTLLSTLRIPPLLLIVISESDRALFKVSAI